MTTPTPAPSVRQDGTQPCWEVLRDGTPADEESNPHFDTHARAETWLIELRDELAADADPLDDPVVLTIDLVAQTPCWIVVCAGCDSKLGHPDLGGTSHHSTAQDAEENALDDGWHLGPDGQLRCADCGPWPEPTAAEDRRPGPGQAALDEVGP